jgi:hypothetical protein
MPSLHVGWAVWVALVLDRHAGRRWMWAYPPLMTVIVMATSNHYLLDAVAGALCALLGWWASGLVATASRGQAGTLARGRPGDGSGGAVCAVPEQARPERPRSPALQR